MWILNLGEICGPLKLKFALKQATKAQRRSRGRAVLFFLTSALGVVLMNATSRPLYPREGPSIHCIGGWVVPGASLDGCGKSRPPSRFDPRTVQPVAKYYIFSGLFPHVRIISKQRSNNKSASAETIRRLKRRAESSPETSCTVKPRPASGLRSVLHCTPCTGMKFNLTFTE